jgi:hypothetical protein
MIYLSLKQFIDHKLLADLLGYFFNYAPLLSVNTHYFGYLASFWFVINCMDLRWFNA